MQHLKHPKPAASIVTIGGVTTGIKDDCHRAPKWRSFFFAGTGDRRPDNTTHVVEMLKLIQNTFFMIAIGLVNEMALMCDGMGINAWEAIAAAATKPFGLMPFYPGPRLGGHRISIDPFYLSWTTKQSGTESLFVELAGYINGSMPHPVVDKVPNALNCRGTTVKGAQVMCSG